MMAEKARLLLDHSREGRIMAWPDPPEHKRLGRGVHNFDCATWDRVWEDAVLAGTFAEFTQNPAMKQHLLDIGTNYMAEASPFHPEWGSGQTAPRLTTPLGGVGKCSSGKLFPPFATPSAQVKSGWYTSPLRINFVLRLRLTEFMRFHQRRPAV